ncbi:uncharacterized protein [Pagrus major]|uniref:uncharacterized protein n=1 Tax=Pagrus major TaxID=143350 RepID=UPI003CC8A9AD
MSDSVKEEKDGAESPGSSRLSVKTDGSKDHLLQKVKKLERSKSAESRSVKGHRSNEYAPMTRIQRRPLYTKVQYNRRKSESGESDCLSVKADGSKDHPPMFSNEPGPSETKGTKRSHVSEEEQLSLDSDLSQDPLQKIVKPSTVTGPSDTEKYTVITSPEERQRYKNDFATLYSEYQRLRPQREAISRRSAILQNYSIRVQQSKGKKKRIQRQLNQKYWKRKKSASLAPSTPLTGRVYLKEKDLLVTPVSSATQSVSRLQSMVAGLRTSPSDHLMQIFRSCSRDPSDNILTRVKTLGQTFKEHYTKDSEDMPGSHIDFAENRLKLAEILYYKILENVISQETKRLHGKDMSTLLEQDIFHCSLMACCLEVVLFSYSSQRTFPWIINIFKLSPFDFFKVIEVFIRSEEGLSRDMVKHLNQIEEQILESQAWSADSALWSALQDAGNKVPTVEEVNFSSSLDTGSGSGSSSTSVGQTHLPLVALPPVIHPRIREFRSGLGSARKDVPPSPLSVHDRYSSLAAGSPKQHLFGDDPPAAGVTLSPMSSPAKRLTFSSTSTLRIGAQGSPATVLSFPLQGMSNDRTITLIPVQSCDSSGTINAQFLLASPHRTASPSRVTAAPTTSDPQTGSGGLRHTESLALFFRKVYHLASVRLRDLCVKLDIPSELRGKIWTCFEHTLVHSTDLMKGRHLDQLLLCSVYIISKVTKETHTFRDIMKCYRSQPQASSHVCHSVLLRHTPREQVADENMEVDPVSGGESAEKTNQVSGDANSNQTAEEERGDLIQFYNSVFVLKVKSFVLRYATNDNRDKRVFTPELLTDSQKTSYRFICPGPGVFQCESTGLVFVMVQGAELLYRTVQWDEYLLKSVGKMAAGLLFDIKCSEDAAVRQLHLPHCEVMDAPLPEGLLSVVHITDDGMNVLEPLEVTDTHVVVTVSHFSPIGIVKDFIKRFLNSNNTRPVSGKVLLFLGQPNPKTQRQKLNVFLVPRNIHLDEVSTQQRYTENIQVPSKCKLVEDQSYSLHCPQAIKIQPKSADFDLEFGSNYDPTFEVRLPTNTEEVTLTVKDQRQMVVWEHDVDLTDRRRRRRRRTEGRNAPAEDGVPAEQRLHLVRPEFVRRVSGPVLNQLLDKLLDLDFINDEEMQSVKAKPVIQDKARELIDTVRKKGTVASSVLIAALRKVDPNLSRVLNLS